MTHHKWFKFISPTPPVCELPSVTAQHRWGSYFNAIIHFDGKDDNLDTRSWISQVNQDLVQIHERINVVQIFVFTSCPTHHEQVAETNCEHNLQIEKHSLTVISETIICSRSPNPRNLSQWSTLHLLTVKYHRTPFSLWRGSDKANFLAQVPSVDLCSRHVALSVKLEQRASQLPRTQDVHQLPLLRQNKCTNWLKAALHSKRAVSLHKHGPKRDIHTEVPSLNNAIFYRVWLSRKKESDLPFGWPLPLLQPPFLPKRENGSLKSKLCRCGTHASLISIYFPWEAAIMLVWTFSWLGHSFHQIIRGQGPGSSPLGSSCSLAAITFGSKSLQHATCSY